ncbi:MAG: SAM-dependent methyltransferase [Chloroflexi bacterium]|nr:SAM-dependent methyltransferase [Chloroflexota bacterium]
MFTLESVKWLASPEGERVLARLAGENLSDDHTLRLITSLRRDLSGERAGAALELARLRVKAVDKFGADASKMYFTRDALEQASDPLVRRWRSRVWIKSDTPYPMLDLCCSIGSDTAALAAADFSVIGYEIDPVRVEMARLNLAALGLVARIEESDITTLVPENYAMAFFDPARRDEHGNRIYNVEKYTPPLSIIDRFTLGPWAVKLSPGLQREQVQPWLARGASLHFVSVHGDLKEATLSYWGLDGLDHSDWAWLITEDADLHWVITGDMPPVSISEPHAWLIEPDPALIRAGLVADAALKFNGTQLDESIAYFTTDTKPESPWVRAWRILDWMPFNGKKLKAYLRERNVGTVTVKKRGTAVTPDTLIPQLKLKGSESRTLVLTRYQGQQIVIICEDYQPE